MKKILIASLAILYLSACQQEPTAPELTLEQIEAAQMDPNELNIEQIPPTHAEAAQAEKDRALTTEKIRNSKYLDLKPVQVPDKPTPAVVESTSTESTP